MDAEKKDKPEYVDLTNELVLALSLASERLNSAQTLTKLRQSELQATLKEITTEYAENGKYRVTEVNVDEKKIGRVLVTPAG